jgi:LAGLIDADG endonuclease
VERSKINFPTDINYNWIAGFMSGDGCFFINIYKSDTYKTGYRVMLRITFTQHNRDEVLFNRIKKILGCGYIYKHPKINIIDLIISKVEDIYYKMIPLFNKHKVIGVKSLDYLDFCLAAELINKKAHLTLEGLEEIRKIKLRMNKNRYDLYNNVK